MEPALPLRGRPLAAPLRPPPLPLPQPQRLAVQEERASRLRRVVSWVSGYVRVDAKEGAIEGVGELARREREDGAGEGTRPSAEIGWLRVMPRPFALRSAMGDGAVSEVDNASLM